MGYMWVLSASRMYRDGFEDPEISKKLPIMIFDSVDKALSFCKDRYKVEMLLKDLLIIHDDDELEWRFDCDSWTPEYIDIINSCSNEYIDFDIYVVQVFKEDK